MTVGKKRRIIDLSSNETPFGPGPMVIKAIGSYASSVHRYPEIISFELGQSLARLHGLGPDNYIFGAGSNEVIDILLQALLAPKDKVLMSFPTFSQYKVLAEKQGAAIQEVPLEMDFSFNPDAFLSHAGNAKVIFLCNPNNPTGSSISRGDILRVLKEPACVVVDEAYAEFSRESVIDLVKKYENLVVLRTFSKAYGLAGLRVGYGVACRDLAEKILKVKNPFNVNSLAQKSALAALSDLDHLEMTVERILSMREPLAESLRRFFTVYPSCTNFLWVDVSPLDAHEFARQLLDKGLSVLPFGELRGYNGSYVRITIGTREENERLVDAVRDVVARRT